MSAQVWTYIIVALSFTLYLYIAYRSRAGSTKEFYISGGGVKPIHNGMATAADWMSAASFMGMAGIISFQGRDGGVYLMGWTGGYVLLALLLAPYLRKFGKFTVPDFVGDRYYSQTARMVAVLCAIVVSFTYVEITTGVIIGTGVVFIYAVLGGMKGITYTQVAQYCVLIFAYMVPAIFISIMLTGNPVPQLGLGSEVKEGGAYMLDLLDTLSTDLGFHAYTHGVRPVWDVAAITCALMVGTAGLPHVIVRFYTVPSVSGARMSAFWALLFIAILYTTAPAVAAFARANLLQTVTNATYSEVPAWFSQWEETGLLSFEDKNGDGRIQYYNDANQDADFQAMAAAKGWQGNELTIDRDIIVLANPEIAQLPNWVIGLVAAGCLAAALSTAAGLLLVISTAFAHDLVKRCLKPDISEKAELMYARVAAGGAVVVAAYFGIHPPDYVAAVVAFAFGLAAASFFPAILMGIFQKKMNREGAVSGMIVGIVFTAAYIIYFKFVTPEHNNPDHWLFGISPEGIGTIGMFLNFIVSQIVMRFTAPPPQEVQDIVENIRTP
ncbi:MAG: sodium:solute symporter family protein [Verrucomicrobiia bacterium]